MSGYLARNPLMPPEAPSWLPPEDAAVLERLRSPAALNPLLGPDPYGGAAIGTSTTRPQAQAVDANGQPFDPVVGSGALPVTRGQLADMAQSAWKTAGAVSDGGIAAPGMMGAIKVYHGSPHDFDRFDMSKIGTGEGAQAYGHGLYFAEKEGTARAYRDALSPKPEPMGFRYRDTDLFTSSREKPPPGVSQETWAQVRDGSYELHSRLSPYKTVTPELIAETRQGLERTIANRDAGHIKMRDYEYNNAKAALAALKDPNFEVVPAKPSGGKMYEVNLDVEPHQLLDWDKPVAGQSAEVQAALKRAAIASPTSNFQYAGARDFPTEAGAHAIAKSQGIGNYTVTPTSGGRFAISVPNTTTMGSDIAKVGGDRVAASAALRDAGIPGIQYLDAGSRSAGTGTSNFVMFDDGLIQILRKYGLPGVVTGGAAAAAAPGQGDTP